MEWKGFIINLPIVQLPLGPTHSPAWQVNLQARSGSALQPMVITLPSRSTHPSTGGVTSGQPTAGKITTRDAWSTLEERYHTIHAALGGNINRQIYHTLRLLQNDKKIGVQIKRAHCGAADHHCLDGQSKQQDALAAAGTVGNTRSEHQRRRHGHWEESKMGRCWMSGDNRR